MKNEMIIHFKSSKQWKSPIKKLKEILEIIRINKASFVPRKLLNYIYRVTKNQSWQA